MPVTTSALQIMRECPQGDHVSDLPEEFWALIDRYRGELVNQAFAILGTIEEAEDVVQETFCEVYRDKGQALSDVRSIGAWLRTINKANALNRVRDRKRAADKVERKQVEEPSRTFTTGGFSTLELKEMLAIEVENLPEHQRSALILRYWEHFSTEEIAERTGQTARTVRRHLCDATLQLYERLSAKLGIAIDPTELFAPENQEERS